MGVLVIRSDGDKERFDDADAFHTSMDGAQLFVTSGQEPIGIFAAGGWTGVRHIGSKPKVNVNIDGSVGGKTFVLQSENSPRNTR